MSTPVRYKMLDGGSSAKDEHEPFIDGGEAGNLCSQSKLPHRASPPSYLNLLPWILLLLCVGLLVIQNQLTPSELECTRLLNPYSPLIEAGIVEYYEADFDNEFAHQTEYRGPPTVELEEAWDHLWRRGATEVPQDSVHKLNRSSANLVHAGNDTSRGYLSLLEVSHELHCLNMIRQYTWKDYYREHADRFPNSDTTIDLNISDSRNVGDRMHVDHCIETLRLVLMCNSDITPSLIIKDESKPEGHKADFNTFHKCRNFEKIMDWQGAHDADLRG